MAQLAAELRRADFFAGSHLIQTAGGVSPPCRTFLPEPDQPSGKIPPVPLRKAGGALPEFKHGGRSHACNLPAAAKASSLASAERPIGQFEKLLALIFNREGREGCEEKTKAETMDGFRIFFPTMSCKAAASRTSRST
jgi:hypothetical protein